MMNIVFRKLVQKLIFFCFQVGLRQNSIFMFQDPAKLGARPCGVVAVGTL